MNQEIKFSKDFTLKDLLKTTSTVTSERAKTRVKKNVENIEQPKRRRGRPRKKK